MSLTPFRSWSRWIALGFLVLVGLSKTTPLAAQAQTKSYPVSLELLAPTSSGNKIPTVTWGGWPLVFKMSANQEIGIGTVFGFPLPTGVFPIDGETGLIVFEEPDGYLAFTTGTRFSPLGFSGVFPQCVSTADCRPGAVPSLVLLSDAGLGQGGVNLADYVTNVGYELDDTGHRTNVVASLTAPNGFVSPNVTAVDLCVGPQPEPGFPCAGSNVGRLGTQTLLLPELVNLLNSNNVATLRGFVVSGTAPTVLTDMNEDGVIGAKDAELAGFTLLSREVAFQVRTLHQTEELFHAPRSDLDGNGLVDCESCGGGGGRLTPVPR